MTQCEHKYVYGGVKYEIGGELPGTSACRIRYYDWFFCEKCLDYQYKPIARTSTTWDALLFNATERW